MPERPDFLSAYNAVEVPAPLLSMDAIDEQVRETTDTFFDSVIRSLDLSPLVMGNFFEIKWKTLTPMYEDSVPYESRVHGTDDYIQMLRKQGSQTLAAVMYTRDDFNYQIAHFAKYPLLAKTEKEIRELQRLERIVSGLE
jgi:hypothetical protein